MPTITTSTQCVAVVRCLLDVLASKLFHDVGIFSRESFIQILRFNLDSVIVVLESEACRAAEARGTAMVLDAATSMDSFVACLDAATGPCASDLAAGSLATRSRQTQTQQMSPCINASAD